MVVRVLRGVLISAIAVFCIIAVLPSPVYAEPRLALIIGNGSYTSSPLANPVHDASDMASALKRLGFSVILKKNASLQEMDEAVREFGERLRADKGGVGLFYYAGHGIQIHGRNYLIPVGARLTRETDVKYQALDAEMVLDEMANAGNDLNIVILDACRDNPFGRSFRSASRGLAIISSAPKGTFISYSTSPGKVAADGGGRNSPYTQSLMKHMKVPDLPIEEVFKKVRQDLGRRSKGQQIPWELSSLEGSFSFASKGTRVAAATVAGPVVDDLEAERRAIAEEKERLQKEKELLEQKRALEEERKRVQEQRKQIETASARPRYAPEAYGRILFYDDFSSRKSGWPVYEKGQFYDAIFQENRYVMETKNERKSLEVLPLPAAATENYDIELASMWRKGVTTSAYGLVLGQDRDNAYVFGISGNGQSVIWVTVNNVPVDDAMPWKPSTANVSDGRYVENTQRVEVRGEYLSYYVNNAFITRIRNQFPLKSFGICVSRQQAVAFTRIKITQR